MRRPFAAQPDPALVLHKFHIDQTVAYIPQKETWAARGAYVVIAKVPEREGELYRIRSPLEEHERVVRESELQAMSEAKATLAGGKAKR